MHKVDRYNQDYLKLHKWHENGRNSLKQCLRFDKISGSLLLVKYLESGKNLKILMPELCTTFWKVATKLLIQWRPFIARFIIVNILQSSILISLHIILPFELTKDTPYLALSGELWTVFYEYFNRNWSCYKGFLLYCYSRILGQPWLNYWLGVCSCHSMAIMICLSCTIRHAIMNSLDTERRSYNFQTLYAEYMYSVVS